MSQTKITDKSLLNNAVISSKIANNAVISSKIANNAVTSSKFANNAVTSSKIANNAVTSSKIEDYSISQSIIDNTTPTAGRGPSFRAYPSPTRPEQFFSQNTPIQIQLTRIDWDTHNYFDYITSQFKPQIAGYYLIIGNITFENDQVANISAQIWKNDILHSVGNRANGNTDRSSNVIDIVYLNGSTDYVELFGYHTAGARYVANTRWKTYMSGVLISTA